MLIQDVLMTLFGGPKFKWEVDQLPSLIYFVVQVETTGWFSLKGA